MDLRLVDFKAIVADEDLVCQAGEYLWLYTKHKRNYQATMDVINAMVKSVNTTIPKGERHILLLFVDDEGEAVEVHCREFVNKIMVIRELYPPIILDAILKFKENYKK